MFYLIGVIILLFTEGVRSLGKLMLLMFKGILWIAFFPFALVIELARTDRR